MSLEFCGSEQPSDVEVCWEICTMKGGLTSGERATLSLKNIKKNTPKKKKGIL